MTDDRQVRSKVLVRLLGHPLVLTPALAGFSAGTWFWAFEGRAGVGAFAILTGLLMAAGAYVTRVLLDNGRTARRVLDEIEHQKQASWESRLDTLDHRLVEADKDPRPETALRDLRALLRAFEEVAHQSQPEHLPAVLEVRSRVHQLFDHSVHALEQTMRLYSTAAQLRLPDARRPLLEERERLIGDIQAGIGKMGSTLVALQRLGTGDQARGELTRLREALDDSLHLAERVEQRLNTLLEDNPSPAAPVPERPPVIPTAKGD